MTPLEATLRERVERYTAVTRAALAKVRPGKQQLGEEEAYRTFLDTAQRYFDDAGHFASQGNLVLALSALNYAHGWLDAGARLGIFEVEGDSRLFAVDEKSTKRPRT